MTISLAEQLAGGLAEQLAGGLAGQLEAVELVGPKGYVHGWHFVGIPAIGAKVSMPGGRLGTVIGGNRQHARIRTANGDIFKIPHDRRPGPPRLVKDTSRPEPAPYPKLSPGRMKMKLAADKSIAAGETLFHGTNHQFKPGDIIDAGHSRSAVAMLHEGKKYAFASTDPGEATFAGRVGREGHVYRVVPAGGYEYDPHQGSATSRRTAGGFRVVEEVQQWSGEKLAPARVVTAAEKRAYVKTGKLPPGVTLHTAGLAEQIAGVIVLAFDPHELRDAHGRWARGAPGPFSPAVRHLYQLLPQVNQATSLGLYDEPMQGIQAQTHIVTLPGGERVIDKRGEVPEDLDREELSSYLAQAIGAPAPAVYRAAPDRALQEYVPGKTAMRYFTDVAAAASKEASDRGLSRMPAIDAATLADEDARDAIHATPEARAIADLDYLTSNYDRNTTNWMVTDDGRPVAIDHGAVMFNGMPSDSEFVEHSNPMQRGHPGTESPADPAAAAFRQQRAAHGWQLADQLHQVRSQFERTGHMDWFTSMIQTPVAQLIDPADPALAEQQILAHWHDKFGDPG